MDKNVLASAAAVKSVTARIAANNNMPLFFIETLSSLHHEKYGTYEESY
jgi:hypothetical protein